MTVAAFILIVLAVAVMVLVHWRTQKRLEDRITERQKALEEADETRQIALYKQHKDLTKRIATAERATAKMIDETRAAAEDSRLLNQRSDALLREVKARV